MRQTPLVPLTRTPRPASPPSGPTAAEVLALQALRADPAVSVLLTTTAGPRMDARDAARLDQLVAAATRRLATELPADRSEPLAEALRLLALDVSAAPTSESVALYVSDRYRRAFGLPVPVVDRVVLDPTFATRDLVRALHRAPRYLLLVLTDRDARLFEGSGEQLAPARSSSFPLLRPDTAGPEETARLRFLREVDQALGAYQRLHPAPLVLAGVERLLSRFTALSVNTARLAGTLRGSHARTPLVDLVPLVRPVLSAYLRSRQEDALDHLAARAQGRVVSGVPGVWLAARAERPEMLAVEEGLFYPARVSADGDHLTPADDIGHPEVLDDAVDEIIETVLQRGGWVALLDDGALPPEHGRIALTLRRR